MQHACCAVRLHKFVEYPPQYGLLQSGDASPGSRTDARRSVCYVHALRVRHGSSTEKPEDHSLPPDKLCRDSNSIAFGTCRFGSDLIREPSMESDCARLLLLAVCKF